MRKLMLCGLALLGATHCGDSTSPDASTSDVTDAVATDVTPDSTPLDATVDASPDATVDASPDATVDATPDVTADAATDVTADATPDVTADATPDVTVDVATDVTADATSPDGAIPRCESAGGRCVALVPSACADGVTGNADWYSCGGGLGVMCCLPTTTPPSCRAIGTRSEGWYRANGDRICFATCAGATATCTNVGTRSEGWYTDVASAACGDPPVDRLIQWTRCSP
ncbi:MAG: hypothetical protein U0326_40970 [Polyangiales bacterium]